MLIAPLSLSFFFFFFALTPAAANALSPILADFLHRRGELRISRLLGVAVLAQAVVFLILGSLAAAFNGAEKHRPRGVQLLYGCLMSFTGMGYGFALSLFPPTLADAYGFANFG